MRGKPGASGGIDAVNRTLQGPIRLADARVDIAAPTMKGNTVNPV